MIQSLFMEDMRAYIFKGKLERLRPWNVEIFRSFQFPMNIDELMRNT